MGSVLAIRQEGDGDLHVCSSTPTVPGLRSNSINAKLVIRSVNRGEPLFMSRRDTKISQRIEDLAAKLVASIPGQRAA